MFKRYLSLYKKGENEEAGRFKLFGVRPDTASSLRDISVEPIGDRRLDNGVNARLIFKLRKSLDNAYLDWDLSREDITLARNYCQEVKIIVSGGFNPDKIKDFESSQVPVDIYGVGSWLLTNSSKEDINNDFTADVVRIKKNGSWIDMAKVGRQACQNDKLELI